MASIRRNGTVLRPSVPRTRSKFLLPKFIRNHTGLSNNEKAQLANCTTLPASLAQNADLSVHLIDANIVDIRKELANNNAQAAWTIIEKSASRQ